MRSPGLCVHLRRLCLPTDSGMRPEHCIALNILDWQFEATGPNQKWVANFTYIHTGESWLYLAVVFDFFSRRVVGWSMSAQMTARFVLGALMMAVWRRGKLEALMQLYSSEEFQRLLADKNITYSISQRGDCWDNAAMESFFSMLKLEGANWRRYATLDEARAPFDYIERFYNPWPKHLTLGNVSPAKFKQGFEV